MSGYSGRRAPNVSQYLANLNTIPSAADVSAQNDFNLGDDNLDFLTNADFFDFDTFNGDVAFQEPAAPQPQVPQAPQQQAPGNGMNMNGTILLGTDRAGLVGPSFQYGDFPSFPMQQTNAVAPSPPNGLPNSNSPSNPQAQPQFFPTPPNTGDKRKASAAGVLNAADLEEQARLAAEEDKRRRNTAASARFRVKKKQREAELEKRAKELSDKMHGLEARVQQLETENKWLKGLITEKSNGVMPVNQTDDDKKGDERSTDSRLDGVGTPAEPEPEQVEA